MKRKIISAACIVIVIALCAAAVLGIRLSVRKNKVSDDLTHFVSSVKGVSYNLRDVLQGGEEFESLGLNGAMTYYNSLNSCAPRLENLCAYESAEFDYFLFILQSRYNEFSSVFESYSETNELTQDDIEFLTELKAHFDVLLAAMEKENGDINLKVLNKDYFTKIISQFSA